MNYIGPRLARLDGESCQCGGAFVLVGNTLSGENSVWKCGQCSRELLSGPIKQATTKPITSKEFTE